MFNINKSEDMFMLYFEVDNVKFADDELENSNTYPIFIKVHFLNYQPFYLEQDQSANCPGQIIKFKAHRSFNLIYPKITCLSSPKLELTFYKVVKKIYGYEHLYNVQILLKESQQTYLQNFLNKYEDAKCFSINNTYKISDCKGDFSGNMRIRLRFMRHGECQDVDQNLYSDSSYKYEYKLPSPKLLNCINENDLNNFKYSNSNNTQKSTDSYHRELIRQLCANEPKLEYNCVSLSEEDICSVGSLCSKCKKDEQYDPCIIEISNKLKVKTYEDFHDKTDTNISSDELLVQHDNSPLNIVKENEVSTKKIVNGDNPQPAVQKSKENTPSVFPESKPSRKFNGEKETQNKKRTKVTKLHKNKHNLKPNASKFDTNRSPTAKRKMQKFVYHIGNFYPGFGRAHMYCVDQDTKVPAKMGWMWNLNEQVGNVKPRSGWRPGAISAFLREVIREAKSSFLRLHVKRTKSAVTIKKKKIVKTRSVVSVREKQESERQNYEPPPTLRVLRKDGKYYITMYPVEKDDKTGRLEAVPKPMQFTIEKDEDDASSTASDMEIEYSVPTAVSRYRKKPDVVHVETQVKQAEILTAFKPSESESKKKRKEKSRGGKKKN